MITFKDGTKLYFNEPDDASVEQHWIDVLGVYGTGAGFNKSEIAALPKVDISRMETKITSYKQCNTTCDYCLERFFVETFPKARNNYPKLKDTLNKIAEFEPSVVEVSGGELLQAKNKPALKKLFGFLEEIDPNKKIKIEFFSNGIDTETIIEYFKDPRVYITISSDPRIINPRFIQYADIRRSLQAIADIDPKRIQTNLMLSDKQTPEEICALMDDIKRLGINIQLQPINEITGFWENNEKYEVEHIKQLLDVIPEFKKMHSPSNLLFPIVSCLNGNVVVKHHGKVSTCPFRKDLNILSNHSEVLSDVKHDMTVSAGTAHVCTILNQYGILSNYDILERLTYSIMGVSIQEKFGDNLPQAVASFQALYHTMIETKGTLTKKINNGKQLVAVDMLIPQMEFTYMSIVRMFKKIGISVRNISTTDEFCKDDQWVKDDTGKDVRVLDIRKFEEIYLPEELYSKINPESLVAVYTFNNFPYRAILMGKAKHVYGVIKKKETYIYPEVYANIGEVLPLINNNIDISSL